MEQFIHQIRSRNRCPRCGFSRAWSLRRNSKRCKKCRKEWSTQKRVQGFRAAPQVWKEVLRAFLRDRTGMRVAEALHLERHCVHRMLHHIRTLMTKDVPAPFHGTVEIDETFIGGQWRNKPWSVRIRGTKLGHGTSKQAVFGMLHRESGQVIAALIPNLKSSTLLPLIRAHVCSGSTIYTDGWSGYYHVSEFFKHEQVDHFNGVYVRGIVHTNSIESFWGYLKRRLKITGGIRPERFALFVGEEMWRFNHRQLPIEEQTEILYRRLVED